MYAIVQQQHVLLAHSSVSLYVLALWGKLMVTTDR